MAETERFELSHQFPDLHPITVVSSFLGHSNTTETFKTYSHLFKGALNETMDIINKLK